MGKALTILIKPASSACNLQCGYCFYRDVSQEREHPNLGRMSNSTLERLIERTAEYIEDADNVTFAFQGGEPTLCGKEFFETFTGKARQIFAGRKTRVSYALQTNGLLLDDDFCSFLAKERFLVGLSLDGPAELHNRHRHDFTGKGSYQKVMAAACRLTKHSVDYNVLTVVTRDHVHHPDKLFNFYQRGRYTHVQLIPCIPVFEGSTCHNAAPDDAEYGNFLCRIFDRWLTGLESGHYLSIRAFDNLVGLLLFGEEPEMCSLQGRCGLNPVVEADGSVYPCDFYVLDCWKLGDIATDSFHDILTSDREKTFLAEALETSDRCSGCDLFRWCRGGCRRMKEPYSNACPDSFYWCQSQRQFIPFVQARIHRVAAAMRKRRAATVLL